MGSMTETPRPPEPNLPPPGFYPDSNGVQRYWDGNAWTEQTQGEGQGQGQGTQIMTPGVTTADAKPDRPWYKRKRFVIPGVLAALLLVGSIAAGSEDGSDDKKPAASAAAPAKDSDNDGVTDAKDAFPSDPNETKDDNNNGVGDVADAQAAEDKAADEKAAEEKAAQKAKDKRKKQIANASFVSKRHLALVFKDPDSHTGELFKVWGEVMQFDAATGTDAFLASTAHTDTRSYGYFEGENAYFTGKADALAKFVEEDLFVATVEVTGSLSYDTQMGGNTTVPEFRVLKIHRP